MDRAFLRIGAAIIGIISILLALWNFLESDMEMAIWFLLLAVLMRLEVIE